MVQRITKAPHAECPACGSPDTRRLTSHSSFILEGSDWSVTDYACKNGRGNGDSSHHKTGKGTMQGGSSVSGSCPTSCPGANPNRCLPGAFLVHVADRKGAGHGLLQQAVRGGDDDAARPGKQALPGPLAHLRKKVINKYGLPRDRQAALRQVAEMGTEEAATVWLERFTFRIGRTIGDEETVTHLLDIIDRCKAVFDRDIERKVLLVQNLREFRDRLLEFSRDENEELRVQAVEGLIGPAGDGRHHD